MTGKQKIRNTKKWSLQEKIINYSNHIEFMKTQNNGATTPLICKN